MNWLLWAIAVMQAAMLWRQEKLIRGIEHMASNDAALTATDL